MLAVSVVKIRLLCSKKLTENLVKTGNRKFLDKNLDSIISKNFDIYYISDNKIKEESGIICNNTLFYSGLTYSLIINSLHTDATLILQDERLLNMGASVGLVAGTYNVYVQMLSR